MRTILLLISLLFISSCRQTEKGNDGLVYTIDLSNAKEISFQSIFDTITYIPLETTKESEIGHIGKILYYQSNYIIIDILTNIVSIFENNGKFHSKIDASGNGPGEYVQLTDMAIDESTGNIKILDAMQGKIITYTMEGKFVKESILPIHPAPLHFCQIQKDLYAFDFQRCSNEKDWRYNLCVGNEDFSGEINKFIPYDKPLGISFSPRITLYKLNGETYYLPLYSSTVYNILPSGIYPRYKFDFGDKWIDQEFIDIEWDNSLDFMNKLCNTKYIYYFNLLESNTYIYAEFMHKDHQYHLVIDKKNNHTFLQRETDAYKCHYTETPMCFIEDKLVVPLTPTEYNSIISYKQEEVVKSSELLPEEGNPVLMHVTFKKL